MSKLKLDAQLEYFILYHMQGLTWQNAKSSESFLLEYGDKLRNEYKRVSIGKVKDFNTRIKFLFSKLEKDGLLTSKESPKEYYVRDISRVGSRLYELLVYMDEVFDFGIDMTMYYSDNFILHQDSELFSYLESEVKHSLYA